MSLTAKIQALNDVDLSRLQARVKALRDALEASLRASGQDPNSAATKADIERAASGVGLTVEQFIEELEAAKRRGMI